MIETINSYDKLIKSTSNIIRTLKIYPKVFGEENFHELHKFFDKALFNVLNQLDLIIGLKYLDISQSVGNNLEANYFSRIVILTSHEILNDSNKMIGKEIRAELSKKNGLDCLKELDETTKEMNVLKKNHLKKLKNLRNNVIGHKFDQAQKQTEIIVNIDNSEIYKIGDEILKVEMKFLKIYTKFLEIIN